MAKHTPELAQLVVGAGGVGALVDYVGSTKGNTRLPGIMALGYIAAFTETLALSVIAEKGLVSCQAHMPPLISIHSNSTNLQVCQPVILTDRQQWHGDTAHELQAQPCIFCDCPCRQERGC